MVSGSSVPVSDAYENYASNPSYSPDEMFLIYTVDTGSYWKIKMKNLVTGQNVSFDRPAFTTYPRLFNIFMLK
jgi:hypothetical protein